jgi:peptidoglycan/LPS O-acetylase OafA/YrhL
MPLRWRLGRRPALDGLRGIAILLVLTCHFGMALGYVKQSTGAAGVELFFVLSGFLITSLLIEEQARTGRVSLRSFYLRRARRLLPALLVMVAVVYVLARLVGSSFAVLPTLFYVANFYPASDLGLLAHTWSLSVEEQFYLTWPLMFVAASRWRRGPLAVAGVCAALSLLLRFLLLGDTKQVYYGTGTEAFGLLVGVLLAILAHEGLPALKAPRWLLVGLTLPAFGLAVVGGRYLSDVVVPTVIPILAAPLIWAACSRPVFTWAPLRYLGRRSYALYLWHFPLLVIIKALVGWPITPVVAAVALGLSLLVTEASWRLVEQPFMRPSSRVQHGDGGVRDDNGSPGALVGTR